MSPLRTVWTRRSCFHPETKCLWIVIDWDNLKQRYKAKLICKSRSGSYRTLQPLQRLTNVKFASTQW